MGQRGPAQNPGLPRPRAGAPICYHCSLTRCHPFSPSLWFPHLLTKSGLAAIPLCSQNPPEGASHPPGALATTSLPPPKATTSPFPDSDCPRSAGLRSASQVGKGGARDNSTRNEEGGRPRGKSSLNAPLSSLAKLLGTGPFPSLGADKPRQSGVPLPRLLRRVEGSGRLGLSPFPSRQPPAQPLETVRNAAWGGLRSLAVPEPPPRRRHSESPGERQPRSRDPGQAGGTPGRPHPPYLGEACWGVAAVPALASRVATEDRAQPGRALLPALLRPSLLSSSGFHPASSPLSLLSGHLLRRSLLTHGISPALLRRRRANSARGQISQRQIRPRGGASACRGGEGWGPDARAAQGSGGGGRTGGIFNQGQQLELQGWVAPPHAAAPEGIPGSPAPRRHLPQPGVRPPSPRQSRSCPPTWPPPRASLARSRDYLGLWQLLGGGAGPEAGRPLPDALQTAAPPRRFPAAARFLGRALSPPPPRPRAPGRRLPVLPHSLSGSRHPGGARGIGPPDPGWLRDLG